MEYARIQVDRNRLTRDQWDTFEPHRQRVTRLLAAAAAHPSASLCLLGAGNGNDIDLPRLLLCYGNITLVDTDGEALRHCVNRLPPECAARVRTISAVDVTGILDRLFASGETDISDREIGSLLAARPLRSLPCGERFDVVASTCLLTQLIDAVVRRLGGDHPRLAEVSLAVRDGHLTLIDEMTRPLGTSWLFTDFVSSDTLPALASVPEGQLQEVLATAINGGNFFTGVNPAALRVRWADPSFSGGHATIRLHPPWRWRMGDRQYAVIALERRKGGASGKGGKPE